MPTKTKNFRHRKTCPECKHRLELKLINFNSQFLMCPSVKCKYPLNLPDLSEFYFYDDSFEKDLQLGIQIKSQVEQEKVVKLLVKGEDQEKVKEGLFKHFFEKILADRLQNNNITATEKGAAGNVLLHQSQSANDSIRAILPKSSISQQKSTPESFILPLQPLPPPYRNALNHLNVLLPTKPIEMADTTKKDDSFEAALEVLSASKKHAVSDSFCWSSILNKQSAVSSQLDCFGLSSIASKEPTTSESLGIPPISSKLVASNSFGLLPMLYNDHSVSTLSVTSFGPLLSTKPALVLPTTQFSHLPSSLVLPYTQLPVVPSSLASPSSLAIPSSKALASPSSPYMPSAKKTKKRKATPASSQSFAIPKKRITKRQSSPVQPSSSLAKGEPLILQSQIHRSEVPVIPPTQPLISPSKIPQLSNQPPEFQQQFLPVLTTKPLLIPKNPLAFTSRQRILHSHPKARASDEQMPGKDAAKQGKSAKEKKVKEKKDKQVKPKKLVEQKKKRTISKKKEEQINKELLDVLGRDFNFDIDYLSQPQNPVIGMMGPNMMYPNLLGLPNQNAEFDQTFDNIAVDQTLGNIDFDDFMKGVKGIVEEQSSGAIGDGTFGECFSGEAVHDLDGIFDDLM